MTHSRLISTIAAVIACSAIAASQAPTGHAVFQQALAKERVDGNLQDAIKLYERVVTEFASDRALAAQALVQVGRCYEKLGREEAVKVYERLVRDFADQEDAVELARVRLAVLKRPTAAATATTMPVVRAFPSVDNVNQVLSLSPDGMKAAFINYDKGQNLAVYDMASQQTTRLTDLDWTSASSWVWGAAWSPDGKRIAYMQCPWQPPGRGCELRASTPGGEAKVMARSEPSAPVWPEPGGWLPDGTAVVVTLGRADRTYTIGLVPTAGGPFTPLRSITSWAGRYPAPPSVSPDGRWIAFTEGSQGMREIHAISPDGRTMRRITDHPADDHSPLWAPDGSHLSFISTRHGTPALWTVAIKDGQPAGDPVRIKDGMQDATLLSWTPRGLAYSDRVRTEDIYLVTVDPATGVPGGNPRPIAYRRSGRNVAPGWSPDGKYLAFVSSSPAEPDRQVVVLLPAAGGQPREFPIPTNLLYAFAPYDLRWFGDSRGLGFSGYDARGDHVLFRLTLASAEWKTFPLPVKTWTRIEWNADGSRYFYARQGFSGDDPAIVERDLQSDRDRIVFRAPPESQGTFRGLRFSPDRRSLAIKGNFDAEGIVVLDLETPQTRVVYDKAAGETLTPDSRAVPTWSPDGRALLVQRTEKQVTDLRLIPVDGGEVRRIPLGAELTKLLASGRGGPPPTLREIVWSPDGSQLALVLSASRIETLVLENPLALASAAGPGSRR